MRTTDHVILTRFNLPTSGVESLVRAREGWLRERVELFVRYCAPSVAAQQDPGLRWLIYFDPETPAWVIDRLAPLVEGGLFIPRYRTSVPIEDLVSDLREVIPDRARFLMTTNLDNDDALASDACRRLGEVRTDASKAAVYLTRGLVKGPAGLFLRTDRRNAFVSVLETWDAPVTSWSEYHNEFPRVMPTIDVAGPPAWLQVIHGSNVSNRVRGRLVSARRYRARFAGMLDDVPEPSPGEITRDLVVRRPARVARDLTRSMARRTALGLLGKERYGELKLRLAPALRSLRPRRR